MTQGSEFRGRSFDALVIGGGFFGCSVAEHLARQGDSVVLLEREPELMTRASFNNQARVHQGYHYPRSLLTGLRSRVNFERFAAVYGECIDRSFTKLYAVGRQFSHVTAAQFRVFCERIGAPLEPAPPELRALFDARYVEDVFLAEEWAFDADRLRAMMHRRLLDARVDVRASTEVVRLRGLPDGSIAVEVSSPDGSRALTAQRVFLCAYSGINRVLGRSGLPLIPLKHEMAEMALVRPPARLRDVGVTIMCGPFFSIMPFPPRGLHTLSHVRYTPHFAWHERDASEGDHLYEPAAGTLESSFVRMVRDAQRFVPCLTDCRHEGSLWETKTVLPASESDDSRPILFRVDHGMPNLTCIMGGKIDNVFDVFMELDLLRAGLPTERAS